MQHLQLTRLSKTRLDWLLQITLGDETGEEQALTRLYSHSTKRRMKVTKPATTRLVLVALAWRMRGHCDAGLKLVFSLA